MKLCLEVVSADFEWNVHVSEYNFEAMRLVRNFYRSAGALEVRLKNCWCVLVMLSSACHN